MLAKYFSIIRNYVLSVSSQRKYNFYDQNTFLDAFRMNSSNIIGRNPSIVIPLLANQDLTPMLMGFSCYFSLASLSTRNYSVMQECVPGSYSGVNLAIFTYEFSQFALPFESSRASYLSVIPLRLSVVVLSKLK